MHAPMLCKKHNSGLAGLLSLAIIAATGHTPIIKVRLAALSAEALRQARALAQTGLQGKGADPGKTDSRKPMVIGSSCDTWDRTLRSASARAAASLAILRSSSVLPFVAVRPALGTVPVDRPVPASAWRVASNPKRSHAPPAVV